VDFYDSEKDLKASFSNVAFETSHHEYARDDFKFIAVPQLLPDTLRKSLRSRFRPRSNSVLTTHFGNTQSRAWRKKTSEKGEAGLSNIAKSALSIQVSIKPLKSLAMLLSKLLELSRSFARIACPVYY
jgi:hypothetical protein